MSLSSASNYLRRAVAYDQGPVHDHDGASTSERRGRHLLMIQYISVYPVALSVRSTNVYEERSLGLFNEDEEEEEFETNEKGAQAVAKYLGWQ